MRRKNDGHHSGPKHQSLAPLDELPPKPLQVHRKPVRDGVHDVRALRQHLQDGTSVRLLATRKASPRNHTAGGRLALTLHANTPHPRNHPRGKTGGGESCREEGTSERASASAKGAGRPRGSPGVGGRNGERRTRAGRSPEAGARGERERSEAGGREPDESGAGAKAWGDHSHAALTEEASEL